jgi:probable phosphoglycerate mutase
MTETTHLCLVRHGETDWNIEQRMQGNVDLPLNARGEAQRLALGRYFSGLSAAALYSSDLMRARQTAQPIVEALLLPLVLLLPALRERHFGRCEGLTMAEVAVRYAEDASAIERRDPDYAIPGGGESLRQHQLRVLDCVDRLVHDRPGQTIVIVTHGGVLDVIYRRALGLPLDARHDCPIPNAGINRVAVCGEQWLIECWGETAHLG